VTTLCDTESWKKSSLKVNFLSFLYLYIHCRYWKCYSILKIVVFIEVNVTFFIISLKNTFFGHKVQKSSHLVNIIFFLESAQFFYIENDGQNIKFFIFQNLSKTLYFYEKIVIIYLFLVRFQIRLIHMIVLFILHVTKEKNTRKVL